MFGTKDGQRQLVVMTGEAGIGTFSAVGNIGFGRILRLRCRYGGDSNAEDEQCDATTD